VFRGPCPTSQIHINRQQCIATESVLVVESEYFVLRGIKFTTLNFVALFCVWFEEFGSRNNITTHLALQSVRMS
jgi:hypothetical protein